VPFLFSTLPPIAPTYGVHPKQVGFWKKQALAGLPDVFSNGREQLQQQADVELDFLKNRAELLG
jgi:hypothetical protein